MSEFIAILISARFQRTHRCGNVPPASCRVPGRNEKKPSAALINLLDNAIKHSPSRSEVAGTLSLNARLSTLNLSVTIHGPGIPPSEHVKTFERFYLLAGP